MPIQLLDDKIKSEGYDANSRNPLQSFEWGMARKRMGIEVLRITDGKDNYQLTFHKIPFTNFKIGYLPRSTFPSNEVLEFLKDYGKKHKVIFLKIEPNLEKSKTSTFHLPSSTFNIIESPHPLFPTWTQVLDLTKSEEEILKNMHPKTRYNIRLSEKKGVKIKEMSNEEGFEIFKKLYFETCKRQKYYGHTEKYHKIIWTALKDKIAHILIAFYGDVPLAAYELFYFNKVFYYPYGGTSIEHRNLMASNLLMFEAIKLGKKLGATKFDMWGSLSPTYDSKNPWSGFTRFKEGYGTKFVEMIGSFDLIINPSLYKIYVITDKFRSLYLDIKRLF